MLKRSTILMRRDFCSNGSSQAAGRSSFTHANLQICKCADAAGSGCGHTWHNIVVHQAQTPELLGGHLVSCTLPPSDFPEVEHYLHVSR